MLIDFLVKHWEIIMGVLMGGSGVLAWIFRWFEGRAAQKETVANRAMILIDKLTAESNRLATRIDTLETRDVEKSNRIDQLEDELDVMERWVNILIGQLKRAGIEPAAKPVQDGNEKPHRPRGFRP